MTWRERLWTAPAETRIGRPELCEAIGRSRSWVTKAIKARKIPYRKNTVGELVFVVGQVRDWLEANEVVMVPGSDV